MKWKPKDNEVCYSIIIDLGMFITKDRFHENGCSGTRLKDNNCFYTKKEAQAKLNQIKKILKGE